MLRRLSVRKVASYPTPPTAKGRVCTAVVAGAQALTRYLLNDVATLVQWWHVTLT